MRTQAWTLKAWLGCLVAIGVFCGLGMTFLSFFSRAYSVHFNDVYVVNNSGQAIWLDLDDEGPPSRTERIGPHERRLVFRASHVLPGYILRFWNADRTRVLEKRNLDPAYSDRHFDDDRLVLEYPKGTAWSQE